MTQREFIREHRQDIDAHIRSVCPNIGTLNDTDRQDWCDNDENLYNWQHQEARK